MAVVVSVLVFNVVLLSCMYKVRRGIARGWKVSVLVSDSGFLLIGKMSSHTCVTSSNVVRNSSKGRAIKLDCPHWNAMLPGLEYALSEL